MLGSEIPTKPFRTFIARGQQVVVMDEPWGDELDITEEVLSEVEQDGRRIWLRCANGEAEYVLTSYDLGKGTFAASFIDGWWVPWQDSDEEDAASE